MTLSVLCVTIGLIAGLAWSLGLSRLAAVVTIGAALALASGVVALWRFEWFLLLLLGVRPLLDGISLGADQRAFNASTALGVVFIGASALWLVEQHHRGTWVRPSAATIGMALFVCAAGFSVAVSARPGASAAGTVRLLSVVLMFAVLEQLLAARPDRVRQVLAAVLTCTTLVLAWSAWQLVAGQGVDPYSGLLRAQGPFVHANVLGKFLVVVLLALVGTLPLLRDWRRAAALTALLPVVLVLCLTFARNAWLAAVVGVLYLLTRNRRHLAGAFLAVVVTLFATVPALTSRITDLWSPPVIEGAPGNSLVWRVEYWRELLPLWRSSPLNGTGLETVPALGSAGLQAHNIWVQALVETGLLGFAALVLTAIGMGSTLRRRLLASKTAQERALSHTAVAVALALLLMTPTENLLSETTTLWYAAAAMTFGYTPALVRQTSTPALRRPRAAVRQAPAYAHAGPRTSLKVQLRGGRTGVRARVGPAPADAPATGAAAAAPRGTAAGRPRRPSSGDR